MISLGKRRTITISDTDGYIFLKASFPLSNSFNLRFFDQKLFKKLWKTTQNFLNQVFEKAGEIKIIFFEPREICFYEWASNRGSSELLPDIMTIIFKVYSVKNEVIEFKWEDPTEEQLEQIEVLKIQKEMNKEIKEIVDLKFN